MFNLAGYSYYAGRLFGVPIRLHWTLLVFMLARVAMDVVRLPWVYTIPIILICVLSTVSILWHELAHALAARHYGYPTQDITLLAFGGLARIGGNMTPSHELRVSAAGPLSNLFLWLLLSGLANQFPGSLPAFVLSEVAEFNFLIGLFNLIPAFPLDGGSMLLAGLRTRMQWARAEWYGYSTGMWIGAPLAILCLIGREPFGALVFYMCYELCSQRRSQLPPPGPSPRPRRTTLDIDWNRYQVAKPSFWQRLKSKLSLRRQRDTPRKFRVIHSNRDDEGPVN